MLTVHGLLMLHCPCLSWLCNVIVAASSQFKALHGCINQDMRRCLIQCLVCGAGQGQPGAGQPGCQGSRGRHDAQMELCLQVSHEIIILSINLALPALHMSLLTCMNLHLDASN